MHTAYKHTHTYLYIYVCIYIYICAGSASSLPTPQWVGSKCCYVHGHNYSVSKVSTNYAKYL